MKCFLAIFAVFVIAVVPAAAQTIDFTSQIRPILSDRCFHCHGPDAENQDSEFRLDSEEHMRADLGGYAGVVPGDSEASELVKRIFSDDENELMPPPDSHRELSEDEKRIVRLWIEQGALYEGHWAFELPERPEVPHQSPKESTWSNDEIERWSAKPIDVFVARKLIQNDLLPSPVADFPTRLRRVSLTLTGQLPSSEAQSQLEASPNEQTFAALVDDMLASIEYAERQALRWLDAARYADTDGYQNDAARANWPWRDWVIKAYRSNMPFDQFTIEQLAGDMLPDPTDDQLVASAFNRNHRQNNEGGALAAEFFVENVIDRVETTSVVWLGLTMGCARCHDHKYDPLSQREFYQLYGYFNNIGEKGIGRGVDANPTIRTVSPLSPTNESLKQAVHDAMKEFKKQNKGFKDRLKKWTKDKSADVQKQIAAVDSAADVATDGKTESTELVGDAHDKLSQEIRAILALPEGERLYPQKRKVQKYYEKLDSGFRAARSKLDQAEKEWSRLSGPLATVMIMRERDGEQAPFYLLDRGAYDQPQTGEPLTRGVPEALLSSKTTEQPTDRLALARWLVSPESPLTARVIVNRIWQDHFGVGLVKTSDDFGLQGEMPSHPELLDYLATEFVESGWDIRAMHRRIVLSEAMNQVSHHRSELTEVDPENRLIGRGPRYRADGFVIRDIALQASGMANTKVGGPPVKPYQPAGLWESVAANKGTVYRSSKGNALYRRSMYSYWKRAVNPPRQTIFDAGGREVCKVRVNRTNTPLQALALMNDRTFVEAARQLGQRTILSGGSDEQRVGRLYQWAVARPIKPNTYEILSENLEYFREHFKNQDNAAKQFVSVGSSKADESLDLTELAAWTAVAHLVLNTDEFVTIE